MRGRILCLVMTAVFSLVCRSGDCSEDLDIKDWLSRPGTRLLVVEFYSVHCKPCMAAVPGWKRLHEKYQGRGLRFVVVSTDVGVCAQPDWTPDDVVCDVDGIIKKHLEVDLLPQAFVWSWQGDVLVAHGHLSQVEEAVETYFRRLPRIFVAEPDLGGDSQVSDGGALRALVRSELADAAKFEIVATNTEAEELSELGRLGYRLDYDQQLNCQLGGKVSPNSNLSITLRETKRGAYLVLSLFSIEDACLKGSATAPVIGGNLENAARTAVQKLVRKLIGRVETPKIRTACTSDSECGRGQTCDVSIGRCIARMFDGTTGVLFVAQPSDSELAVDGAIVDGQTMGDGRFVPLAPGKHNYVMRKTGYRTRSGEFHVLEGEVRTVREVLSQTGLRRDEGKGWLKVSSNPEVHAQIAIDGKEQKRTTPYTFRDVPAGEHEITLRHPLYKPWSRLVTVKRDDLSETTGALVADFGRLQIDSTPRAADVYVDGVRVGTTPYQEDKAKSKAYKIRVTHNLHHTHNGIVYVRAGETSSHRISLKPAFGAIVIEAYSGDELVEQAEVLLDYKQIQGGTPLTVEYVPSKTHFVQVRKRHHRAWSGEVVVEDGKTVRVKAQLAADFATLSVRAKQLEGSVLLGGKKVGQIGDRLVVAPGDLPLEIVPSDKRYKPVRRKIGLAVKEHRDLDVVFELRTGAVLVDSEPAGAMISLNGNEIGEAPQKLSNVEAGTRRITAALKGYTPRTVDVQVREDDIEQVIVRLTELPSLSVTCIPRSGEIKFDGRSVGHGEATLESLEPGRHRVGCHADGYADETREVQLHPGQREELVLSMSNRPILKVECSPELSDIRINGEDMGDSPKTFTLPSPGHYRVSCTYPNRKTAMDRLYLGGGKTKLFSPTLGKYRWYDRRDIFPIMLDVYPLRFEYWDLPDITENPYINESDMAIFSILVFDFTWRPSIFELGGGLRLISPGLGFNNTHLLPPAFFAKIGLRLGRKGFFSILTLTARTDLSYHLSDYGDSFDVGDLGTRFVNLDSRFGIRIDIAEYLFLHLTGTHIFGDITAEKVTGSHQGEDGPVADTSDVATVSFKTWAAGGSLSGVIKLSSTHDSFLGVRLSAEVRKAVANDDFFSVLAAAALLVKLDP